MSTDTTPKDTWISFSDQLRGLRQLLDCVEDTYPDSRGQALAGLDEVVAAVMEVRDRVAAECAAMVSAELNAMARGNAASHDWHRPDVTVECRRCHTRVYGTERLLEIGAAPACGERCPGQPWHEISSSLPGEPGAAKCIFCHEVYPATAEAVEVQQP